MCLNHKRGIQFFLCFILNFIIQIKTIDAQFPVTLKSFSGGSVRPMSIAVSGDSGYLVSGQNISQFSAEFFKLSNNGEILWVRKILSAYPILPLGFKQAKDGGYWIFGEISISNSNPNGFVCKLNACGNLLKGVIFRSEKYSFVFDLNELSNQKLIINQGGTYNKLNQEYSFVGLFDFQNSKWMKQILYPLGTTTKKSGFFSNSFYCSSSWYFKNNVDTTKFNIGSAFACYDTLLNFRYCKGLSAYHININPKFYPQATSNTILNNSGNVIVGSSLRGFDRLQNAQPASILKMSNQLEYLNYFDLNNNIGIDEHEIFEYVIQLKNEDFLVAINVKSDNSRSYDKTIFYSLDSSYGKKKEFLYGDTNINSYRVIDLAQLEDSKTIILLEQFIKANNVTKYHFLKMNSNLGIDSNKNLIKQYDTKCTVSLDSFSTFSAFDFDTLNSENIQEFISFTEIKNIYSDFIVSVYPNPASERLCFSLKQAPNVSIHIYDMNGKEFFKKFFKDECEIIVDVSDYPKGFYLIQLEESKRQFLSIILIN